MGLQRMSRALRCDERSRTGQHNHLILSSEQYDPLSLEVMLKRSRFDLGLVQPMTLQVSLKQAALMMQLMKGASL